MTHENIARKNYWDYWWSGLSLLVNQSFGLLLFVQTALRMDSPTGSGMLILRTEFWRFASAMTSDVIRLVSAETSISAPGGTSVSLLQGQHSNSNKAAIVAILPAGMLLSRVSLHINSNTNPWKKKKTIHQSPITGVMWFLKEALNLIPFLVSSPPGNTSQPSCFGADLIAVT